MKIIILSEDSAKHSYEVLFNIIKCSIQSIDKKVDFSQIEFNEDFNKLNCIKGANWKIKKPRKDFIDFINDLMYELLDENNYIFWHIDGDEKWSKKDESENLIKFNKIIENIKNRDSRLNSDNVILVMPFYSIESWLYHFLEDNDFNAEETYLLKEFSDLEEILKIKDSSGIFDTKNLYLSSKISHDVLYNMKKSYYSSFKSILSDTDFINKISERIYKW